MFGLLFMATRVSGVLKLAAAGTPEPSATATASIARV